MFAKLHKEAVEAAKKATAEWLAKYGDRDACGFAWVEAPKAKLSTREGKALAALGFKKSWAKGLYLWNPSGSPVQSISPKEQGARAYAEVMRKSGLEFRVGSRLD